MNILDWFLKTKNTLSEFLAFLFGFLTAIFIPNILGLEGIGIVIAILIIFIGMRGLEWVLAKVLGEKDKKLSRNNYFAMVLFFPFLAILSYILFRN
ncbi:hypothetical protein [Cytobacillus purgationiresistens]|uniref:Uncharacterized protein n=1 Tax=Cytobacillus purgationiresistens TaxID=863449 RepID=A0ABU0AAN9_9BACI|nr:hypothetical protein [Cytobacillus purgationiresistens]MDQ0268318.1 hypothetical protein [Cytobacillus purgationiresistens]